MEHRGSFSELSLALDDLMWKTACAANTLYTCASSENDKKLCLDAVKEKFYSVNKVFDVMNCRFGDTKLRLDVLLRYDEKLNVMENLLKEYGVIKDE